MTIAWPSELPQYFQKSGYSEGVADAMLETQPDIGPPIGRLRSSSMPIPVSGNMICTGNQLVSFKTFFNTTVSKGVLPFTFPAQSPDGNSPSTDWLVKFTKQRLPSWEPLGGDSWRVSFQLLILP